MSPKLPAVTGREVTRVAEKLGFTLRHQIGDWRVTPQEFADLL